MEYPFTEDEEIDTQTGKDTEDSTFADMEYPFTEDEETNTEKENPQTNTIFTSIMNKNKTNINNEEDILDNLPLADINDIIRNTPIYETDNECTQQFNLHHLKNET